MSARLARFSSHLRCLTAGLAIRAFRRGWRRKLVCLALILSLLMWPGPALHQLPVFASALVDAASDTLRSVPPYIRWLFRPKAAVQRPERLAERIAAVSGVRVSPQRFVGYLGQNVTFTGLPADSAGRTIQGVRFTWESADSEKVKIDDDGNARFLQPGLANIICRAGLVSGIATVLVKPGTRRVQTDADWNDDQGKLSGGMAPSGDKPVIDTIVPALWEKLAQTVYAQGGGGGSSDFPYDELWSEPRNLVGSPRNRAIEPTRMGVVLPEGSNFEFAIALEKLAGRGMSTSLNLYYNSRVWSRHGNAVTFNAVNGWPFAGFSMGFGRILTYGAPSNTKYVLIDPNGTRHYLGAGPAGTIGTYQSSDGTHTTFVGSAASGGTLYFNSGMKVTITVVNNLLLPTQMTEPNGNYAQIAYKSSASGFAPLAIDYVTDSLARVIQFQYDANFNLTSINAPGVGGTSQNPVTRTLAQFDYQSRPLGYNFSGLTVENAASGQTLNTLRHVYFPVTHTGYLFSYSDYGMIYNTSLRRQMSIDGNGVISDGIDSASINYNYPSAGTTSLSDAPAFTQRTETPGGTFNYSTAFGSQTLIFSVARPDSSTLLLTRSTNSAAVDNGLLTQTEIRNSVGTSFARIVNTYANDPGGSPQVQSTINYDEAQPAPNQIKVDFDYDAHGNVTSKREYGYQVGGVFQLQRRTQTIYKTDASYINAYLRGLPIEIAVLDPAKKIIAKSTNTYDDYAAYGGMENYGGLAHPPGHLPSYNTTVTVRGNVTGTTQYTDVAANTSITRLKRYDIFGNVVKAQVSCCNSKSFTCTETNCWGVPEQETDGSPSGPQTTSSSVYDFNTSAVMSQTDANNVQVSYNYDQLLRPTQSFLPTGALVARTYNDAALSMSNSVSYFEGGLNKTLTTTQVYDGWLKVIQKVDAAETQTNTSYDAMGRVQSVTNPFQQGTAPGPATSYQYDALGRVILTTSPDNNTVQTAYNGNIVTVTDQCNRKLQRQTDGLRRLIAVNEQDVSTGALTQSTTYTYDRLDNLTLVNQGNQTRSFKYDALKRLLYERIPEENPTINDGAGTLWSCKYTYTDFSKVATRTDARGVVTTYGYDPLNRLQQISYNTSNAPGVAPTATVIYAYGPGSQLRSVGACNEFYESYGYDQYSRQVSISRLIQGRRYTSFYQYNEINQKTQVTDPAGSLALQYDNEGRVSGVGGYLTNMAYNAAGQVAGFTLGNGVTENFTYDANRLQLTAATATSPGGQSGGLLNLNYSYQASAGQMGAGSTAGNAGQLMAINNNSSINGTPEIAAYTYDNVGRITTSNQTSNGSTAQRRFVYDRWGNRTSMWDAVTGGNQIQSVTLAQDGAAPANRIQSVTGVGTLIYAYDAAGNNTNDGVHDYAYDAENRLVSIDNGATGQYLYDAMNRRVMKQAGAAKTDYVWAGNQVIEEHDGSGSNAGSLLVRYIYAGAGMIAKVAGGNTQYFLSDRLSVRVILDSVGNVVGRQGHLPFGEDFGESGTQEKHHFTSYERDTGTNTDYAVNRFYRPTLGTFDTVDPILDEGFKARSPQGCTAKRRVTSYAGQPQSNNRFSYSLNNPVNNVDPYGLESWNDCMYREFKRCGDATVSAGTIAGLKMVIIAIGCFAACASAATGVGIAACVACISGLVLEALGSDSRSSGEYRQCLEDRRFRCSGLSGEPNTAFDFGDDLFDGSGNFCFGFTCDPFRTGEWEPFVIDFG